MPCVHLPRKHVECILNTQHTNSTCRRNKAKRIGYIDRKCSLFGIFFFSLVWGIAARCVWSYISMNLMYILINVLFKIRYNLSHANNKFAIHLIWINFKFYWPHWLWPAATATWFSLWFWQTNSFSVFHHHHLSFGSILVYLNLLLNFVSHLLMQKGGNWKFKNAYICMVNIGERAIQRDFTSKFMARAAFWCMHV